MTTRQDYGRHPENRQTSYSVILEVHLEQPDRSSLAPGPKNPDQELKSPKYQGTKLRAGHILMLGGLVECSVRARSGRFESHYSGCRGRDFGSLAGSSGWLDRLLGWRRGFANSAGSR
jgi:hypothetical protein